MQFKKAVLIFIYFFKNWHNLKLHHLGSVCTMYVVEPQINACAKGRCHDSTYRICVLGIFKQGCTDIWV